jgi:predicted transglutaminase-like cysteine proteinase
VQSTAETAGQPAWRQGSGAKTEEEAAPVQVPNAESEDKAVPAQVSDAKMEAETVPAQIPVAMEEDEASPVQPPVAETATRPVWRQGSDAEPQDEAVSPQVPDAEPEPVREQGAGAPKDAQSVRLFQSAAFRGNFNALPKWKRVLSKAPEQVRALNTCVSAKGCPPGSASWQRVIKQARGQAPMEQLRLVNSFFNKWPYRLDQDAYGTSDWWATPNEFLKISGDCEDYAIIKYFALRELGYSQEELRIVVVKDRIRGIAHAILAVFLQGEAYVLDNVSNTIFPHTKFKHYTPQYSLNEKYRWSHIPATKQP